MNREISLIIVIEYHMHRVCNVNISATIVPLKVYLAFCNVFLQGIEQTKCTGDVYMTSLLCVYLKVDFEYMCACKLAFS